MTVTFPNFELPVTRNIPTSTSANVYAVCYVVTDRERKRESIQRRQERGSGDVMACSPAQRGICRNSVTTRMDIGRNRVTDRKCYGSLKLTS